MIFSNEDLSVCMIDGYQLILVYNLQWLDTAIYQRLNVHLDEAKRMSYAFLQKPKFH
jgi:hypothetical protein